MIAEIAGWKYAAEELLATAPAADGGPSIGKWVFVGSLGLLLLWLIFLPKRLIRDEDRNVAWWRNVRLWAIVVCIIQMWVYWQFA